MNPEPRSQQVLRAWQLSVGLVWLYLVTFYAFVARAWHLVGFNPAYRNDSPISALGLPFNHHLEALIATTFLGLMGLGALLLLTVFSKAIRNRAPRMWLSVLSVLAMAVHVLGPFFYWFND